MNENHPSLKLSWTKSEQINGTHKAVFLPIKRPFENLISIDSKERIQEQDDSLSLETASFKRKIRKPLKFQNEWKFQECGPNLKTSKQADMKLHERLFEQANQANEMDSQ